MGAHPFSLALHTGKKAFLGDKASNGVGTHSLGAGQIFQTQGGKGRQHLQKGPHLADAHAVQHDHAKLMPAPVQRQKQPALARQQPWFFRGALSGKIERVTAETQERRQLAAQLTFHFHEVFTGKLLYGPQFRPFPRKAAVAMG